MTDEKQSQEDSKSLFDFFELSFFVPLITVLLYVSVYFEQRGLFSRLQIPDQLLKIELTEIISFISIFCILSIGMFFLLRGFVCALKFLFRKISPWAVIIAALIVIVIITYAFRLQVTSWHFFLNFYCLLLYALLLIVEYEEGELLSSLGQLRMVLFTQKKIGGQLGFLLAAFCLISLSSFVVGYVKYAQDPKEKGYITNGRNDRVLLKRYSDYSIYNPISALKGDTNRYVFIIQYSAEKSDTLVSR